MKTDMFGTFCYSRHLNNQKHACLRCGVLLLVFVLTGASCQNQDANDVIVASGLGENIPSAEEVIAEIGNVTDGNDSFCRGFSSDENPFRENLTWLTTHAGGTASAVLKDSICGAIVFRDCLEDGEWGDIDKIEPQECLADTVIKILAFIGFGVSLVACGTAFAIFMMTRSSLRGLRHYQYHIHWNLIASFILYPVVLLVSLGVFSQTACIQEHLWLCNLLSALLAYFVLANFFWMLVEGLVLFVLVATAFPGSQRGKAFVKWCFIGWGIPAVLVTAWIVVERVTTEKDSYFVLKLDSDEGPNLYCLIVPIFAALVVNGIVLVVVMRILWLKLRDDARNTLRYSNEKSSWRAAKSTFVILVLLGVYFALPILVFRLNPPFLVQWVISKISHIVNSLQGLAVCTLYVFCNAEVRRAVRNLRRRYRSTNVTYSTRLSSPSSSRSATPRHSKSHSSSEGSATKRPSTTWTGEAVEIEMAAVADPEENPQPRRQTCVVMEPLVEDPSESIRGDPAPADV
ncbi:corticotropin-releasing factor receptor 1-like isoform X2 [Acanthaster planci]|uniref:Corticotropin-releasing factor receptor 1-like isoform X2 n=1 Tax=Acanthaster planci TaxID=133434 RepID=A0A8B7YWP6_ACAPL|nr:corticotropin-releasing factor receptor 1-like isoform X2 [Acanthaster planci]